MSLSNDTTDVKFQLTNQMNVWYFDTRCCYFVQYDGWWILFHEKYHNQSFIIGIHELSSNFYLCNATSHISKILWHINLRVHRFCSVDLSGSNQSQSGQILDVSTNIVWCHHSMKDLWSARLSINPSVIISFVPCDGYKACISTNEAQRSMTLTVTKDTCSCF